MHVMVCGGAGYVGAHMARRLAAEGHQVIVVDNFSTGHRAAVRWGRLVEADLLNAMAIDAAFAGAQVDAVMHFCACSLVGESMRDPYLYFVNNVAGSLAASICCRPCASIR